LRSMNPESPAARTAEKPAPINPPPPQPERSRSKGRLEAEILAQELGRPVQLLTGRVLDPQGQPIPEAEVALGDKKTVTDSQGEFALPQGTADLTIRHPRFFPRALTADQRRVLTQSSPALQPAHILVVLFWGGTIRGKVVSPDGQPIAGAAVRFSSLEFKSPGIGVPSLTDAEGRFQSPILPPGGHHLFFKHPDYQSWETTVTLPLDTLEARCDAALRSGSKISIQITDGSGNGLPDARLWLISRDPRKLGEESRYLGSSGDKGILEARWDAGPSHRLRVTLPGYREVEQPIFAAPEGPLVPTGPSALDKGGPYLELATRVTVRLDPAPLLAGLVIDKKTGLPVAPLKITLEMGTPEGFLRASDRGVLFHSLPAGHFRVGLPPFPGTYRIAIQAKEGLAGFSEPVAFDGRASPAPLSVYVEERGGLQGILTGNGQPIEGARVELFQDVAGPIRSLHGIEIPSPPNLLKAQTTGPTGKFEFADLAAGFYRLHALHPGHAELFSPPVSVPAPLPIPLALKRGARLGGRVFNLEGNPEAGVPLILLQRDHPFPRFASSNASGSYEFSNLPDASYILFIGDTDPPASEAVSVWSQESSGGGIERREAHQLEVRDGKDLAFDLHFQNVNWGVVTGTLTAAGAPLAGIELRLAASPGTAGREISRRTGAKGEFRFYGLPADSYSIRSSYPPVERHVTVERGKLSVCPIELRPQALAVRLVRRGKGTPILAEGSAEVFHEDSGLRPFRAALADGEARFSGLYPGGYRLRLAASGYLAEERSVEIADQPVNLTVELRRGIRVQVTILDGAGHPAKDSPILRGPAEVVLLRDGIETYRSYGVVNGEVLLPELSPGTYQMTIRGEAGTAQTRFQVTAPEGEAPDKGEKAEKVDQKVQLRLK
ncbi:MAG: carboxypeptidase regulatory-like domain-containing protein, partial [Planctomycetes bacterium]|nr:carboxypeptidase regulatory-like domain-containing protein [Planctomycetota bacterium]